MTNLKDPLQPNNSSDIMDDPSKACEGDIFVIVKSTLLTGCYFHNLPRFSLTEAKPTYLVSLTHRTWYALCEAIIPQTHCMWIHWAIGGGAVLVLAVTFLLSMTPFYFLDIQFLGRQRLTPLSMLCGMIVFVMACFVVYRFWFFCYESVMEELSKICDEWSEKVRLEGYELQLETPSKNYQKFYSIRVHFDH